MFLFARERSLQHRIHIQLARNFWCGFGAAFIVQGPDSGVYGRTRHPPTCSEGFIRARGTTGCLAILLRMRYLVPSGFLGETPNERTNERTNGPARTQVQRAGSNFRNSQALTGMFSATLPAPHL